VNFYKVPEVKKSILWIGKIILNSVYSGNIMNSDATFLCTEETSSTLQKVESKTKDSRFGFRIISTY